VLAAARRAPGEAFLGLDADGSRMREASRHAARPARKGGLPGAWFAVAAAEALPSELDGRVDDLWVTLPWGSLLRGVLGPEPWFLDAAARVLRAGGTLRVLLSVTPRDGLAIPELDARSLGALARRWQAAGWCVLEARDATAGDVADAASSWAKRLGIPDRRSGAVLRLGRPSDR
jgi:16S rRNA (adenine(1408)-N(1))-methyltransferase